MYYLEWQNTKRPGLSHNPFKFQWPHIFESLLWKLHNVLHINFKHIGQRQPSFGMPSYKEGIAILNPRGWEIKKEKVYHDRQIYEKFQSWPVCGFLHKSWYAWKLQHFQAYGTHLRNNLPLNNSWRDRIVATHLFISRTFISVNICGV